MFNKSVKNFSDKKTFFIYTMLFLLILFLLPAFCLARFQQKRQYEEKIAQYITHHSSSLDKSISSDLYDFMEVNLYHYLKPSTFGQFLTNRSSDSDFITRMRMSAIDSMRLQKNLKSLILYRSFDSLLLSTLSMRTDFTDSNPAYTYVMAAMHSEQLHKPCFIPSSDGDIFYYFPFFEPSSPREPSGCAMIQLRSPSDFFNINVDALNAKGTFLILCYGQIISVEGYNILSTEIIENILTEVPPLGRVFTYDNADISSYSFYCAPSSVEGMQYLYYEPVIPGFFSMKYFPGNSLTPFLFACAAAVLFFLLAVFQPFYFDRLLTAQISVSSAALPADTAAAGLFPPLPFSHYSAILIEYKGLSGELDAERLQNAICRSCEQYLSGCQISYHIQPQQLYICCYINYSEYNLRVLVDSLKQTMFNTVENCLFSFYFTDSLDSAEQMLDEARYLKSSLHYTRVLGYWKRSSANFIRACEASTAAIDADVSATLRRLLNEKDFDGAVNYLKAHSEKIPLTLFPPSEEYYSYHAIYSFMENAFLAVKSFFLEKSCRHPLTEQNMSSVMLSHPGFEHFFDFLIQAITEYREANEQSGGTQDKAFLNAVYLYIEQNLSSVTLNSMAEHFHITSAHLSRMFKKNTGQNFSEYLSEKKLQKAIELLEHADNMSINEISKELGYSTPAYFLTKFKERYGVTPSAYRKSYLTRNP